MSLNIDNQSPPQNRFYLLGLVLTALTLGGLCVPADAATVFSNNFETNTNGFSAGTQNLLPVDAGGFGSANKSNFLGFFDLNSSTTLSLTGLTAGTTYDVDFDLFAGRSLDGNSTFAGPDRFSLVAGATTLVDATFQNLLPADGILNDFTQTYSDATPTGPGAFPGFTGADVSFQGGGIFDRYGIYYFGHGSLTNPQLSFIATGTTASLTFSAIGLQGSTDEFFAIDNVVVSAPDAPSTVPDSGASFALLGVGLLGIAFFRQAVASSTR